MKLEGNFKLKNKIQFNDVSFDTVLPESDLCFTNENSIYQFSYIEPEKKEKITLNPGTYVLRSTNAGLIPEELEIRSQRLLESVTNTKTIVDQANLFFNNLDIYDELELDSKTRKILIYSGPGMGKSATITSYCNKAVEEDPGTIVLIWPTCSVRSSDILSFFSTGSEYSEKSTRLILVAEDIGGGEREGSGNARAVDSAMLEILDGISNLFRLPTFIIATTNYPQNLLEPLADRPSRFDEYIKLDPPSAEERIKIVEFFAKRSLTDEEKNAVSDKSIDSFSLSHLKEMVIRSRLHQKTFQQCIKELNEHKKRFKKGFDDKNDFRGFGS